MLFAHLISKIENFYKKSFNSYLQTKIFKQANDSLLAEYDNFEIQDKGLFERLEGSEDGSHPGFISTYKTLIAAIDEAEKSQDGDLLEEITDDLGLFSKFSKAHNALLTYPYLSEANDSDDHYAEDFDPKELERLLEKIWNDGLKAYRGSPAIELYLDNKEYEDEYDGGDDLGEDAAGLTEQSGEEFRKSEIQQEFDGNQQLDTKEFGEHGSMTGRGGTRKYDPIAAKRNRDQRSAKVRKVRKSTPAEIEADFSLKLMKEKMDDAKWNHDKKMEEDPKYAVRYKENQRKSSLSHTRRMQAVEVANNIKNRSDRIVAVERLLKGMEESKATASESELESLILDIAAVKARFGFERTQGNADEKYRANKEALETGGDPELALAFLVKKLQLSVGTQRATLKEKLSKSIKAPELQEAIASAKASKNKDAIKAATANMTAFLMKTQYQLPEFEIQAALVSNYYKNDLSSILKSKTLSSLSDPLNVVKLSAVLENGKDLMEIVKSNQYTRTSALSLQEILHLINSKLEEVGGETKEASKNNRISKRASMPNVDVNKVISMADALNIEDPAAYAKKITQLILAEIDGLKASSITSF